MPAIRKETADLDYGRESVEYSPKKKRIKRKKKNNNVIKNFKNTAMMAITFALGILIVYNYAMITDKQMELNSLNQEIETLNNDMDDYNIALEGIKNTNSVERMAKAYLGMNYPTSKQTVFVDFTYGSSETTEDETQTAQTEEEGNKNILVGLIDKMIGFIQ